MGTTPQDFLRDSLLIFLRKHFASSPNFPWKGEPEETKIDILDEWSKNRETSGLRPALIVVRGGSRHVKLGLQDLLAQRLAKDITEHIAMIESIIRVRCISKQPLESETLGSQVYSILRYRKYDYLEMTGAVGLEVSSLSARIVTQSTSETELVDTPVDVMIKYIEKWKHHSEDAPTVGGFDFQEPVIEES